MVNGISSWISLSGLSFLVYRNTRDLCLLILYTANIPSSLIRSSSFMVVSLGFSMYSKNGGEKNEIMPFAATWMDPEVIILSQVRKRKDK